MNNGVSLKRPTTKTARRRESVKAFNRRGARKADAGGEIVAAIDAAIDAVATKRRLLDVAGAVFAEVGYQRAGVRDICGQARANVAAVKYHFGGKFQLYEAAIGYWFDREEREQAEKAALLRAGSSCAQGGAESVLDPSAELRAFIATFLGRLLDSEKPAWHSRLVAREMAEPTGVLDAMVKRSIRPTTERLRHIVRRLVGPDCAKESLERAMLSVLAQCVFYVHGRPVLERVFPHHINNPDVAALADHIATFSTAGIRAICAEAALHEASASKRGRV